MLDADIDRIISIFKLNERIDKVVLFGSRAKGNFDPGSDIDLTLKGRNLSLDDILEEKGRIAKLSLPYKIDIVLYDRITEKALLEHIERVGIALFDREAYGH